MIGITTFLNAFNGADLPTVLNNVRSAVAVFEAEFISHSKEEEIMTYTVGELHNLRENITFNLNTSKKVQEDYGADVREQLYVYGQLLAIVEAELRFCSKFTEVKSDEKSKEQVPTTVEVNTDENIIKGVQGLADALGIGKNKAQAIISDRVLIDKGVQYKAGGWRFKKNELEQLLKKEPLLFEDIKCKR